MLDKILAGLLFVSSPALANDSNASYDSSVQETSNYDSSVDVQDITGTVDQTRKSKKEEFKEFERKVQEGAAMCDLEEVPEKKLVKKMFKNGFAVQRAADLYCANSDYTYGQTEIELKEKSFDEEGRDKFSVSNLVLESVYPRILKYNQTAADNIPGQFLDLTIGGPVPVYYTKDKPPSVCVSEDSASCYRFFEDNSEPGEIVLLLERMYVGDYHLVHEVGHAVDHVVGGEISSEEGVWLSDMDNFGPVNAVCRNLFSADISCNFHWCIHQWC